MQLSHQPFVLIILDGWGERADSADNAIAAAHTPHWDALWRDCPHTLLIGSGDAVGLPVDQMGNSEVGHLTIGSGRTVYQEFTRINKAIVDGEFFHNPAFVSAVATAKTQHKALHILGLLSPGGVHSHESHLHAMVELAAKAGLQEVYLHLFLDGRDTPPQSALASIAALEKLLARLQCGQIASVIGRFYAMDRDQRWDRVQVAYNLLTQGKADYHAVSAKAAVEAAYARGETDEFVKATLIYPEGAKPITIQDGDAVVFMNYRADRARELTHALTDVTFTGFSRAVVPRLASFVTLTQYATNIKADVAFMPQTLPNVLGDYLAQKGIKQLRLAETEKYAHVTFFFNGGIEPHFSGEERILVPSTQQVPTYDLQPAMSAPEITEHLLKAIQSKQYGLIVCNFANADMVGHTGNFPAAVQAVEIIDQCLGRISAALESVGGEMIITADHGNAECMYDAQTHQPHTAHTTEPVPFVYRGRPAAITHQMGTLADIAPTLLYLMGLPIPPEMTGKNLLALRIP